MARGGTARAPAKPWRGGAAPPPKVYLVEPRNFRELVQRLTGAAGTAAAAPMAHGVHAADVLREADAEQQFEYASWFSVPLLSPDRGFDVGCTGNDALL